MNEDSYEDGEGGFVNQYDVSIKKSSFKDLMKELSYYGFSNNPKDYSFWFENGFSEIMTDCLQNSEGNEPSKSEIELWKNGEITLYNAHLSAHIVKIGVSDLSKEELDDLGFNEY